MKPFFFHLVFFNMACLNISVKVNFGTKSGHWVIWIAKATEQAVLQILFSQPPSQAGGSVTLKSLRKNFNGQLLRKQAILFCSHLQNGVAVRQHYHYASAFLYCCILAGFFFMYLNISISCIIMVNICILL